MRSPGLSPARSAAPPCLTKLTTGAGIDETRSEAGGKSLNSNFKKLRDYEVPKLVKDNCRSENKHKRNKPSGNKINHNSLSVMLLRQISAAQDIDPFPKTSLRGARIVRQ